MTKIEPFDAYRYYQALKLHFESESYDATKYNFKTSTKPQTFWKRKDKYFFAKIASRFKNENELINYFISFFIEDSKWVGDMLEDESPYSNRQKRLESLTYVFSNDIETLTNKYTRFDQLFEVETHPMIIKEYLNGSICLETVVIIHQLVGFMKTVDVKETMVWPDLSRKILKYSLFLKVNLKKYKKIVLNKFTQCTK